MSCHLSAILLFPVYHQVHPLKHIKLHFSLVQSSQVPSLPSLQFQHLFLLNLMHQFLYFFSSKPISCENVLRVPDPSSLVITITFPNLSRPDICSFNMLSCVPTERQPQIAVKTMILHVLSTISVFAIFKMIIYHPYGL